MFWSSLLIIVATGGVLGLIVARTWAKSAGNKSAMLAATKTTDGTQHPAVQVGKRPTTRNLSLQPEALKLSRNLGQRFMSTGRETSVLIGSLITGTDRQAIRIQRHQNDRGESVEVAIGAGPTAFTWSSEEGPKAGGHTASERERMLIEQLTFDSVDQFVLAQLREASYYTVARNVMPVEIGGADNYSGPVWDIVRVDDPETDEQRRPSSPRWSLWEL